jgi:hypothetical protein
MSCKPEKAIPVKNPYDRFPLSREGGFISPKNAGLPPGVPQEHEQGVLPLEDEDEEKEKDEEMNVTYYTSIKAHYECHEVEAAKWSGKVATKWEPKEGMFKQSAEKIAGYLKRASKDLKQAMSRLNFYINRAGDNLTSKDKARLELAKEKLRNLYKKEAA